MILSLVKETCENAATLIAVGWSARLPLEALDKPLLPSWQALVSGQKDFSPEENIFFWSPEPLVSDVVFTVAPKQDKPSHLPSSRGRLAI